MRTTARKICEVLTGTVVIPLVTVMLYWAFAIIQNLHSPVEPGKMIVAYAYGVLLGLATMGVFLFPSAFLVSLLLTSLKRWSWAGVLELVLAVVVCSSICAYVINPGASAEQHGAVGYLTRGEWLFSQFNLIGIVTGTIATLLCFWALQCCRRRASALP